MNETSSENGPRKGQQAGGHTGEGQARSGGALEQRSSRPEQQGVTRASYIPPLFSPSPAALMSTSPFAIMRRFTDELDQIFSSFGALPGDGRGQQDGALARAAQFAPQIEVLERDNQLLIRADLPGISPDQVRVTLVDSALVIEGERRSEQEHRDRGTYRSERSYGAFRRVIPLPAEANEDKAEARFDNGVLEVAVPLDPSRSAGRRLEIGKGGPPRAAESSAAKSSPSDGKERSQSAQK
jgi:HSP20 family protein